jgi:hypothetical protein
MLIDIHTSLGDVRAVPPGQKAYAVTLVPVVRCFWRPIPACRLDRLVGDVWASGEGATRHVEDCLVTCADNGRAVYRDRASGIVLLDSPIVRDEILGRLTPDPRSSQGGARG